MKKHTLIGLGLLFLSFYAQAHVADSTLRNTAILKMKVFAELLKHLAGPELDLTTKALIEKSIEVDFLDNEEVRFYQDLNNQFGHAQEIAFNQYFTQLKVLYPNGAMLKTEDIEASDFFYNQARDMYYLQFRCFREFKGFNVLAKKEVRIVKSIDYQVKVMEAGQLKIEIVGGRLSEGELSDPKGLDISAKEISKQKTDSSKLNQEALKIQKAELLLTDIGQKVSRYETLAEVQKKKTELKVKESKRERKARKVKENIEKDRLARELSKAKQERKSLYYPKINIRIGGGLFLTDSSVNSMLEVNSSFLTENWMAKADVLYKFAGMERHSNGTWGKGHAYGIFMNYGKQSYRNLSKFLDQNVPENRLDTVRPARGFFELETGFMFREEFRISAGAGLMHYNILRDGQEANATKQYFIVTTGLSPRLNSFLEMDFNLSWLLIDKKLYPRANLNLIILLKCKR